jgi:hypothetical protein
MMWGMDAVLALYESDRLAALSDDRRRAFAAGPRTSREHRFWTLVRLA